MLTVTFILAIAGIIALWRAGLKRPDGLLQLPFLTGFVFAVYPLTEALVLYADPDRVPEDSLWRAFVMMGLACALTLWGYKPQPKVSATPPAALKPHRLLIGALLLEGVAVVGYYKMTQLFGGITSYYSMEGGYSVVWEGPVVKYNFLRSFIYPALVLLLTAYRLRPSNMLLAFIVASFAIPAADVVFMTRRTVALLLLLFLLLHLFFSRRFVLPRWTVAPLAMVALIAIYIVPVVREHAQIGADRRKLLEFDLSSIIRDVESVDAAGTFKNGVHLIAAVNQCGEYGYGGFFVDGVIRNFVPRQIFGEEFLQKLFISGYKDAMDDMTESQTGYRRPSNEYYGAFGELYSQFWFLGGLYFYLAARALHRLWEASLRSKGNAAQIFYSLLMPSALLSIADSPSWALNTLIMTGATLGPIIYWARVSPSTRRARKQKTPAQTAPQPGVSTST